MLCVTLHKYNVKTLLNNDFFNVSMTEVDSTGVVKCNHLVCDKLECDMLFILHTYMRLLESIYVVTIKLKN